jgi:hypothetical protein
MPKQAAKGDAAIKKAQNKASRRQMELYIYYVNGRIRKVLRFIK